MQYNIMFKTHTVIRKVYEMQGGGYPFTHTYIYIYRGYIGIMENYYLGLRLQGFEKKGKGLGFRA